MQRSFIVIIASFRFCLVLRIPTYEEIVADDEEVLFYEQRSHLGQKVPPTPPPPKKRSIFFDLGRRFILNGG